VLRRAKGLAEIYLLFQRLKVMLLGALRIAVALQVVKIEADNFFLVHSKMGFGLLARAKTR
jgi:hypothetical protein